MLSSVARFFKCSGRRYLDSLGSVPRGPKQGLVGQVRIRVEHDRVVLVADQHLGTGQRSNLGQRVLDPEPRQPVGEVTDGLVVAEVGLQDPPAQLLATDEEPGSPPT